MQAAAKIDSKIMPQQLLYVKITEIVQVPIVCYTAVFSVIALLAYTPSVA